jgi:hypothetical protein
MPAYTGMTASRDVVARHSRAGGNLLINIGCVLALGQKMKKVI